ncbi:monooxygenase 2-like isoform X1 [Nicotiana tabacum]|uniref:FAD-dependent urate hydroxylase-like isoform X1 n=2 Tax=Nicotiana TaxID=4085 RepID=A0A1S4B7B3_TOBAC|nr:PREDICTED: zeaxanthin epoxidase, chloroplastic-like isoform X1 [Nicotiana sylvestris]XP_016484754.1 PREDICTED: FAD-dependent urate hydroxylase-like isoform X1 [Nicotiana tabacum]
MQPQKEQMEINEDIVIVGAGIAGLATSLALHRLGLRSIVLESSDSLRTSGFALALWTNAWRALDALGVGDSLRQRSLQFSRYAFEAFSAVSGKPTAEISLDANKKPRDYDSRCMKRQEIVETLEKELPPGTIKYSSRVVSIQDSGLFKLLHLADKTVLRTKVLIGCDGVNSVVAKWMGLQKLVDANRSAIRGYVEYIEGHGFEPKFCAYFGGGVRIGFLPCDDKSLYWFCTFTPSAVNYDESIEGSPIKMKQFVLSMASNVSKEAYNILQRTSLDSLYCAKLKLRSPLNILMRDNIVKRNTCLVGDALHPMTPDIGQGGCSALEDSVVLARCIAEPFSRKLPTGILEKLEDDEFYNRIKVGLEKYAKARRWRIFNLISTSYLVGLAQESNGKVISYLREKFLAQFTIETMLRMGDFDCGKLLT